MTRTRLGWWLALIVACVSAQPVTHSGIHREDMDPACKPCSDFWRYVNGGWLDRNPIPARAASWGPFQVLAEANAERVRTILEAAAADANARPGSNRRKMADLYASCMDTAAIDRRGISPIEPDFTRISAIQSVKELGTVLTALQREAKPFGVSNGVVAGPFRLIARQDPKDPTRVVAYLVERDVPGRAGTSIFSLPDREYYFQDDAKSRQIRAAFLEHVARMLELSGETRGLAARHAKVVMALETSLAESVMTIADKRDPDKTYHQMNLAGLRGLAPNFDWAQLFRAMGIPETTPVNVSEPELIRKVNRLLNEDELEDWKTWLRWRVLQIGAPYLARPIAEENFHFQSTVLSGIKEQRPRWQTCASIVDQNLGDALGQAYVEKFFPPEAKRRMTELVENLRAAMLDELEHCEWMQPATRRNAIGKLKATRVEIGYPDEWRDYSGLDFKRGAYFANIRAAWAFGQHYEISKIGKPPRHSDWTMTPPTVNAYSAAAQVEVVFPAGILQPPFFDLQADDAANYGAIGAVIGHELGHQFDDSGSKYDASGAVKNWWSEDDRKKFEARAQCVVDQFNTLDVGEGRHHNGRQVLGEALGDLGGLSVAYRAYHRTLRENSGGENSEGETPGPVLDGFTADQRFFIAFARVWGTVYRPDAVVLQLNTNNHPLAQYRVLATLENMPEFQRAFGCKPGDPMVRPEGQQCKLW